MSDEKLIDVLLHWEQLEAARRYYERSESFARRIRVSQVPKVGEKIRFPKMSDLKPGGSSVG